MKMTSKTTVKRIPLKYRSRFSNKTHREEALTTVHISGLVGHERAVVLNVGEIAALRNAVSLMKHALELNRAGAWDINSMVRLDAKLAALEQDTPQPAATEPTTKEES